MQIGQSKAQDLKSAYVNGDTVVSNYSQFKMIKDVESVNQDAKYIDKSTQKWNGGWPVKNS